MGKRGRGNSGSTPPPVGRAINKAASISKGLVMSCPLTDGGTKCYDYVGGLFANSPSAIPYKQTSRGLATNTSARFTFSTTTGFPKNVGDSNTSPFTVSLWLYFPSASYTGYLFGWGTTGAGWYCQIGATGNGNFDYYDGTRFTRITFANNFTSGKWYHVVCTRDNTNGIYPNIGQKIYINTVDNTVQFNGGNGTPNSVSLAGLILGIGARGASTPVSGNVNNFNMWNRVLTKEEIVKLYTDPYCMYI